MMLKRITLLFLLLTATAVIFAGALVQVTRAQDPTIPTRTPTRDSSQVTPSNPTATDDNQPNPPAPTNTTAPGATATQAATATGRPAGTASPLTSATPTTTPDTRQAGAAGACDDTPFITAVGIVYVYEGPGGDYNIGATLEDGDVRLIVGRAGYADWWVIQVTPTLTGWVDDQDVTVSGNTALAPVVDPPPIGAATPTRGAPWNPTPPFPTCQATATATPTDTPTTTPTATAMALTSAAGATPAAESATTATAEPPTTAEPPATAEAAPGTGLDARGAESARASSPTSPVNLILPLAGLALIAGGIVLALMARNRGAKKPDEPK